MNAISIDKYTNKPKLSRGITATRIRFCKRYNIPLTIPENDLRTLLNVIKQAEKKERSDRKKLKALNKPAKECSQDYCQDKPKQKNLWDLIGNNYKKEAKRRIAQSVADKEAHKQKMKSFKESYVRKTATDSVVPTLVKHTTRKERRVLRLTTHEVAALNAA